MPSLVATTSALAHTHNVRADALHSDQLFSFGECRLWYETVCAQSEQTYRSQKRLLSFLQGHGGDEALPNKLGS